MRDTFERERDHILPCLVHLSYLYFAFETNGHCELRENPVNILNLFLWDEKCKLFLSNWRSLIMQFGGQHNYVFLNTEPSFKQSLPVQVEAPAVFRCIRVTAINDNEAEAVYVATVSISGHMFKGFLYDKGIDEKNLFPRIPSAHLESSTTERSRDSSSPLIDPSNV